MREREFQMQCSLEQWVEADLEMEKHYFRGNLGGVRTEQMGPLPSISLNNSPLMMDNTATMTSIVSSDLNLENEMFNRSTTLLKI